MCRINIRKCRCLFVTCIFIVLLIGICICRVESGRWKVDDVYGNWKVTQLIGEYQSIKGDLLYGNNIGRSFTITNENIIDSTGLERAIEEADEQRCYSIKVLKQEEHVIDISNPENIKEFQLEKGIILSYVGIKDNIISQYTFYSEDSEVNDTSPEGARDYHTAPEFEVFSYSQKDKDKLIVNLPMGFYLLESFKKQENVKNPYGRWMIERLISRGDSGEYGIDFFDYYGQCFEMSEEYVECCGKIRTEVVWEKDLVIKEDYEEKNEIQEGLGLENNELEVWYGTGKNDFAIQLIPVNEDEIIISWEKQWFLATKVPKYEEPSESIQTILNGDWKIVQLLAVGHVDEEKEIWGREDYKAWWYTQRIALDQTLYAENAVTDWESVSFAASEFYEKFEVPENITYLFEDDDKLHIGIREVCGIEEIYVIVDKDTLIRERNGLWYKLERLE